VSVTRVTPALAGWYAGRGEAEGGPAITTEAACSTVTTGWRRSCRPFAIQRVSATAARTAHPVAIQMERMDEGALPLR